MMKDSSSVTGGDPIQVKAYGRYLRTFKWDVFATLTPQPSHFGRITEDYLHSQFRRFLSHLERIGGADLKWAAVFEIAPEQDKPHIHILIRNPKLIKEDIENAWGQETGFTNVRNYDPGGKAAYYLAKSYESLQFSSTLETVRTRGIELDPPIYGELWVELHTSFIEDSILPDQLRKIGFREAPVGRSGYTFGVSNRNKNHFSGVHKQGGMRLTSKARVPILGLIGTLQNIPERFQNIHIKSSDKILAHLWESGWPFLESYKLYMEQRGITVPDADLARKYSEQISRRKSIKIIYSYSETASRSPTSLYNHLKKKAEKAANRRKLSIDHGFEDERGWVRDYIEKRKLQDWSAGTFPKGVGLFDW